MENKYPIYINLLDEEIPPPSRDSRFFILWAVAFVLVLCAAGGIYGFTVYQYRVEENTNQILIMQTMHVQPELFYLPDTVSFTDVLQKKDSQITSVKNSHPSLVAMMEAIEKVVPEDVILTEVELNGNIVITGFAESFGQISQLMAGLQQNPSFTELSFSSSYLNINRIEFKAEMEWKGDNP